MNVKLGNSNKPLIIFALTWLLAVIATPARAQGGIDYWLLSGASCSDAIKYTDNLGGLRAGYESNVVLTGNYGEEHSLSTSVTVPGATSDRAKLTYYLCPYNRVAPYWISYNFDAGADGGYIVSYELILQRVATGDKLDYAQDQEGGGVGACLDISGGITGTAAAPYSGSYYYALYMSAAGSVDSNFCESDGTAFAIINFTINNEENPEPTPTIEPTVEPTIQTQHITVTTTNQWESYGDLTPISFTLNTDAPMPWGEVEIINPETLWWVARVALTIYGLLPDSVWLIFFFILLIVPIGLLAYKLLINPPDF